MNGEDVYGYSDTGFNYTSQDLCNSGNGGCPADSDVLTCQDFAEATCGTSNLVTGWFMSDCGGHASPWHYHVALNCAILANMTWLSQSKTSGHSTLAAVTLDGRGLYGPYESAGTLPTNLDACNGHTGPVPAFSNASVGASFPAASSVYHYHVTSYAPFTVGCFGPVASIAIAKSKLYATECTAGSSCSASDQLLGGCSLGETWTACTSQGQITNYLLGCPIFQGYNNVTKVMEYNSQMFATPTASCPNCTGACTVSSSTATSPPPPSPPPPSTSPASSSGSGLSSGALIAIIVSVVVVTVGMLSFLAFQSRGKQKAKPIPRNDKELAAASSQVV